MTSSNLGEYVAAASRELDEIAAQASYIEASDRFYEQIGRVDAVPDRIVIYHGSLLHSGIIPSEMNFSPHPGSGRLTGNLFIRGR